MIEWMPDKDYGRFPPEYLESALYYLQESPFEILTYNELPWGDDRNYADGYPGEYGRWVANRDASKTYVMLQHDVDMFPGRTLRILKLEAELSIRSNVMIFKDYHDRASLELGGELIFEEYLTEEIIKAFQEYERMGFVIGYHVNVYEQTGYDIERAQEKYHNDVEYLRRFFDIKYCSPHGGARDANGKSNYILDLPDGLNLKWVNNFHGITCKGTYSDSMLFREGKTAKDFLGMCEPGNRYQVLMHPQHYYEVYKSW